MPRQAYRKDQFVVVEVDGDRYVEGQIVDPEPDPNYSYLVLVFGNVHRIAGANLWPYDENPHFEALRCPKCAHFGQRSKPGTLNVIAHCDYCDQDTHAIHFRARPQ